MISGKNLRGEEIQLGRWNSRLQDQTFAIPVIRTAREESAYRPTKKVKTNPVAIRRRFSHPLRGRGGNSPQGKGKRPPESGKRRAVSEGGVRVRIVDNGFSRLRLGRGGRGRSAAAQPKVTDDNHLPNSGTKRLRRDVIRLVGAVSNGGKSR